MPLDISVIIPSFRRPGELLEAISSVLRQENVTVEIIVVDDSPEGAAQEPVKGLEDSRVRYIKNSNPTGGFPGIVRNIGWPRATGTFVHFLDDDDLVPNGYYADARKAFAGHPEAGMLFGRIEPFGTGPESQLSHERHFFERAARKAKACGKFGPRWAFVGRMLFDQLLFVCSACVLRRECVEQLEGFDPDIRLMEDADFYIRAVRRFGTFYMDRVSLHYRIGTPSLMHSPNPSEVQLRDEREGHRLIHSKYRRERGRLEYYALQGFTRALLKIA
jgi:glycosyltransferase involved in cell wall biosynthesis